MVINSFKALAPCSKSKLIPSPLKPDLMRNRCSYCQENSHLKLDFLFLHLMSSLSFTFAETPLIIYSHFLLLPGIATGQWKPPVQEPSANQGQKSKRTQHPPCVCSQPHPIPALWQPREPAKASDLSSLPQRQKHNKVTSFCLLYICISSGQ